MSAIGPLSAAALHARSAAYDIVLLAHVLSALVSLVVVAIAGGAALALSRSGSEPEPLRRYYRPGPNWAGRVLFLVPVLGVLLVAMSERDWSYSDGWVLLGLGAWLLAAVAAELVLWPSEQHLRSGLARGEIGRALLPECRRAAASSAAIALLLVAASVVMVAKP